ncbi:GRF zinc finger domain containing protein [Pyrenophora tritici-repentis Pt-1C-BFP]|uniref:GRF zinc finger domain containing protein n=1 Tax=Pyrenophora tritici-repentis (strain Pt-1C-BFP) TaxID=426418 RepID=B2WNI6_PYRTR|nr:GRF zinc finger domain containing protein [Pyrenophora tritici-repentis Pt-1C-BFP]EDU44596.1 GRF zinc finger domain containing protein [Pyrenophora tritici-repentis Pt-1C-BFP]
MDAFVSRKRKRIEPEPEPKPATGATRILEHEPGTQHEEEPTEFKLALLASLHPNLDEATLLETLLAADGSVEQASDYLNQPRTTSPRKRSTPATVGYQSSLSSYRITPLDGNPAKKSSAVKKGRTLSLYSPEDIEAHTPCSIIHNFLPPKQADALLSQLLEETPTYKTLEFKLFDRVVVTRSTFAFYVNSLEEAEEQKTEYVYDGRKIEAKMLKACPQVEEAVHGEVQRRIRDFYPNSKKLKYQSPHPWKANTAFVNCYDGPQQSVGYHADQLTYLGPRAVIGSLSLGVAREFRVRKIVAEDDEHQKADGSLADAQGQISIHLPHNSLLVMHAEMQEEWKHCIAPAQTIDPHPLAKNKRLNITYRFYKESLHPRYTPKCRCGVSTVLRCATRKKESRGRYMWMCHAGYVPGKKGCSFFQWAEFDDDGEPPWASKIDEAGTVLREQKGVEGAAGQPSNQT